MLMMWPMFSGSIDFIGQSIVYVLNISVLCLLKLLLTHNHYSLSFNVKSSTTFYCLPLVHLQIAHICVSE